MDLNTGRDAVQIRTGISLACVLAAGEGSRMGATQQHPKSMVRVRGKPLIDIQLDRLAHVGVEAAVVVVHPEHQRTVAHLATRDGPPNVEVIQCRSRGGAESLFAAAPSLAASAFLLCTVDSFYGVSELIEFRHACEGNADSAMILAITRRTSGSPNDVGIVIDDAGRVLDIGRHLPRPEFVCEGPIWCSATLFGVAEINMAGPDVSLTELQRGLVRAGQRIGTHVVSWAMDVDTVADLELAESWLALNPLEG